MSELGTITKDGVRFERLVSGPIERVWEFLTTREGLAAWYHPGTIELRVGGKAAIEDPNAPGGLMTGTVTRCDPPRALAYTWGLPMPGQLDSEVSFELEPQGDKVRLVLTHRRLGAGFLTQVGAGWHTLLDVLGDRLAGREPDASMAAFERALARYTKEVGAPSAEGQEFIDRARAREKQGGA